MIWAILQSSPNVTIHSESKTPEFIIQKLSNDTKALKGSCEEEYTANIEISTGPGRRKCTKTSKSFKAAEFCKTFQKGTNNKFRGF